MFVLSQLLKQRSLLISQTSRSLEYALPTQRKAARMYVVTISLPHYLPQSLTFTHTHTHIYMCMSGIINGAHNIPLLPRWKKVIEIVDTVEETAVSTAQAMLRFNLEHR